MQEASFKSSACDKKVLVLLPILIREDFFTIKPLSPKIFSIYLRGFSTGVFVLRLYASVTLLLINFDKYFNYACINRGYCNYVLEWIFIEMVKLSVIQLHHCVEFLILIFFGNLKWRIENCFRFFQIGVKKITNSYYTER